MKLLSPDLTETQLFRFNSFKKKHCRSLSPIYYNHVPPANRTAMSGKETKVMQIRKTMFSDAKLHFNLLTKLNITTSNTN
uniref:Uncharacterized protein n=1 Tax=Onchocerca volvulus TaxID=6282 RepID=A0A8R1TYL9_ONCVO